MVEMSAALFAVYFGPLRSRGYRISVAIARVLLALSSSGSPTSRVDEYARRRPPVQPVLLPFEVPLPGWFVVYFEPAS